MLTVLDVPYADTSADQLHLVVGGPALPALSVLTVDTHLELRLLGASHQAILCTPSARFSEAVAYFGSADPCLPARLSGAVAGLSYRFHSTVKRYNRWELASAAASLRSRYAEDPRALLGVFPGDEHALTVLHAQPGGHSWSTWHVYPATGEIASTTTTVS